MASSFALLHVIVLVACLAIDDADTCERRPTIRAATYNLTDEAGYDKNTLPLTDSPNIVTIQLFVSSITELSEQGQTLTVDGFFRQYWSDPRLARDPSVPCHHSIDVPKPLVDRFWRPDIYFDNSLVEKYGTGLMVVSTSGDITKSDRINHEFTCAMQFHRLPFDTQTCRIKLASYSQYADKVRVVPRFNTSGIVLDANYKGTTAWEIGSVESSEYLKWYNVGDEQKAWSFVHLDITLKRKHTFYLIKVVSTTIVFMLVSWSGFFIDRNLAPARVTMSVIPLLINVNVTNSVYASLPVLNYWTWMTRFLTITTVFATMVIFEYAVVSYFLYLEKFVHTRRFEAFRQMATKALRLEKEEKEAYPNVPPYSPLIHGQKASSRRNGRDVLNSPDSNLGYRPQANVVPVIINTASDDKNADFSRSECMLRECYRHFDRSGDNSLDRRELRQVFRSFGQYFSNAQIDDMLHSVGCQPGHGMNFDHFKVLVGDFDRHIPAKVITWSFWDNPPSYIIDVICKYGFILTYSTVVLLLYFVY